MFEELVCKAHLLLCICNNTQWLGWQYTVLHKLGVQFSPILTNIIIFFFPFFQLEFWWIILCQASVVDMVPKTVNLQSVLIAGSTKVLLSASFFPWLPICPMNMCLVVPTHVCVHVMHVSGLVSITSPNPCINKRGPQVCLGSMHLFSPWAKGRQEKRRAGSIFV
jgi:hypothetical protein